jgi:hypothetical protein
MLHPVSLSQAKRVNVGLRELLIKLAEYTEHLDHCDIMAPSAAEMARAKCTCGLNDIRKRVEYIRKKQ